MIVNNVTKISGTVAYKLLEKSGKKSQFIKIVIAMLLIGSGLFILIDGIITNDSTFITMGCLFTAIGIAYLVMALLNLVKLKKLIYKNNEDICTHGVKYIFKFKEQSIQITTETNNKVSKIEYKYDQVKNVKEHTDFYEIKLKEDLVLYVDKQGFENNKHHEFFFKNFEKNKKKIKRIKK